VSDLVPLGSPEFESSDAERPEPDERVDHEAPLIASEPSRIARRTRHEFIDLPPGSLVGEYEIERKIGEGGMGSVYAAVHSILGKRVAIKVIGADVSKDESAITRFRREARVVAQLASPHIVDVSGFGELPDGRAYFVMEYLVGESLRDRVTRARVPLDEALEILEQIARGLEAAHEAGIVHRDLKPENIFIVRVRSTAPVIKLLDFGIVKLAKQDEDVAKTQAGVLIGTPVYVAPEQIRAAGDVDHRADIYALGGVAFELILGRVPFVRSTVVELIAAHLECAPPIPRSLWPEIPAALDALLSAMLAKDPTKRPTLGYVQEAIEKQRRAVLAIAAPTIDLFDTKAPARTKPAENKPVSTQSTPAAVEEPSSLQTTFTLAAGTRMIQAEPSSVARRSWRNHRVAIIAVALGVTLVVIAVAASQNRDADEARSSSSTTTADARVHVPAINLDPIDDVKQHPADVAQAAPTIISTPIAPSQTPKGRLSVVTTTPSSTTGVRATPVVIPQTAHPASDAPVAPVDGDIAISAKPPCDVAIDGAALGRTTPITGFALTAGIHRVTLENAQLGISETVYVQILAGKHARIVKDYSARLVHVDPNGTINPFAGSGH
jgi:serine/threonine protein kinase